MRPLVMLCPMDGDSRHQSEVGLFLAAATQWRMDNCAKVLDLIIVPVRNTTPAPVGRNKAVAAARRQGADILMMVDDDMVIPFDFFGLAVEFLAKHHGPAVIGVPYCTGPGVSEDVLVFEWAANESQSVSTRFKLERIRREDAARRRGIEQVASLGTGCMAIRMDCFDKLAPPYFYYQYNEDYTATVETEDCWFVRNCSQRGIPLYVSWDHWAGHVKSKTVGKPEAIDRKYIDRVYLDQARAECSSRSLLPHDITGDDTDFIDVYAQAVDAAREDANFVEVGAWLGRSTILMAQLLKRAGKHISFTTVDTFRGSPDDPQQQAVVAQHGGSVRAVFNANLDRYLVRDLIEVIAQGSADAARLFAGESLDFVFVNAQHSYAAVRADLAIWLPKVRPNGTLAGHGFNIPDVRRAMLDCLPAREVLVQGNAWVWKKRSSGNGSADCGQLPRPLGVRQNAIVTPSATPS